MSEQHRQDPGYETSDRPVERPVEAGERPVERPAEADDRPVERPAEAGERPAEAYADDRREPVPDPDPGPAPQSTTTETASSSGVASTTATEPGAPGPGDTGRDPSSQRVAPEGTAPGAATAWGSQTGLLPDEDLHGYQRRWDDLQVSFIDEPRHSVRQADDLVREVTHQIAEHFTSARQQFEQRWDGGDEPTTEELRQALQRYRDFFQRLVAR
ncbi:MAG TPA: hypothetical protein VK891_11570 [Euzebyales bacterium]|nr:hypothetical protein [Euzebyales bacterium]